MTRLMSLLEIRKAVHFVVASSVTVVKIVGKGPCEAMGEESGKSRRERKGSCRQSLMALRCRVNELADER